MNEFLGRAALMVVTDKKTLQKVLTGILIVFIALFTPVIAAVEVLNSDFTIDADELETMLMSHLDESEKAQLQEMDSQIRKLDNKMSSAGYGARTKEAEVLWLLALYGKPTDSKTADKLVKCFKEDQTDNQLVAAVNKTFGTNIAKTFGTNIAADVFTRIMNSIRSTAINISDYVDPSTKNNLDLVKWAKHAEKSGWGYVWGTYGGVMNKKTLERKSSQYPNEVGSLSDFIKKHWLGGRTADCVGLIKGYGWLNPETLEVEYGTNGMKDVGADGMYKNAKVKGPIETMPEVPGLAVWHKGHIGIFIGNGEVIEAMSTKTGVKKTKFSTKRWSHWLEIPYIEYIDEASVH